MKTFPQLNQKQLELLIGSLMFTSCQLASSDNLALTILDVDDAFEHFGYTSPLDKRPLVNQPLEYSSGLFNPLIDLLADYVEQMESMKADLSVANVRAPSEVQPL